MYTTIQPYNQYSPDVFPPPLPLLFLSSAVSFRLLFLSSSSLLQSELDALELEKEHKVSGGRIWKMDNGNIGLYALGTFMAVLQVNRLIR